MTEILYDLFSSPDGTIPKTVPPAYAKAIIRTYELKNEQSFTGAINIKDESPIVKKCIQAWQKAVGRYKLDQMNKD